MDLACPPFTELCIDLACPPFTELCIDLACPPFTELTHPQRVAAQLLFSARGEQWRLVSLEVCA
jgi:hypothetical protein